jgi:hypothetical protein
MLCKAKTGRGAPCKAHAIAGGKVCRTHGGSAPQVQAAAMRRLALAADPAVARLIQIATSKKTKTADAIAAIREILNRGGFGNKPQDAGAGSGQVLWEEFIQIHRRRAGPSEDI